MPDRGFVITFTDVTAERESAKTLFEMNELLERRVGDRTEELAIALSEAERANASKSRFVAVASHDLMQPLSAAKLFVSSLGERLDDAEGQRIVEKTEAALQGAEQIIAALLDISRLDAGKAVFKVQPVRLNDIFSPLRDELAPVAEAKGIALRIVESSLFVKSDAGYLRRIVQNLLSNAIRYTESGRVLLGAWRVGEVARIEVWDTGRGIPLADQETVFREFHRLSPGSGETGLGLGLAIVERACRGLGHGLGLWSEPGTGSCFSLTVPLHESQAHPIRTAKRPSEAPSGALDGMLMMLVENDADLAAAIALMVERFGVETIHATDAEEALEILHKIQLLPDAFVLDHHLGEGATGTELHARLRDLYGPVPAAIVSADRTRELRRLCEESGLPLLAKPLAVDRLRAFLESAAAASSQP